MSWTSTEKIRVALVVFIGFAMVGVPGWHLVGGGERFGWRMFGFSQALPEFTLVDDDGYESPVDVEEFTAALRSDVPYGELLPPHLCRVVDGTAIVIVHLGPDRTEYPCP